MNNLINQLKDKYKNIILDEKKNNHDRFILFIAIFLLSYIFPSSMVIGVVIGIYVENKFNIMNNLIK